MAKATTKLLERLAQQQQQRLLQQQSQPAPQLGTSTAPLVTTPRPAPAQEQGRGRVPVRPAPPSASPITGKLTLKPGTAPPPQVAERIKQMQGGSPNPAQKLKKPKHNGPHPIERLAVMYPTTFNIHAPVPLVVGVDHQIAAALGIHPRHVEGVLTRWTNRMNYLAAMAAPGSRRHNLDGSDAGPVHDEHRADAATKLAEKMAVTLPKAAVPEENA